MNQDAASPAAQAKICRVCSLLREAEQQYVARAADILTDSVPWHYDRAARVTAINPWSSQ